MPLECWRRTRRRLESTAAQAAPSWTDHHPGPDRMHVTERKVTVLGSGDSLGHTVSTNSLLVRAGGGATQGNQGTAAG